MPDLRTLAVIPSRMGAQRFPGKPLADLAGRPVIDWVYRAAVDSGVFDEVVVATPDQEIAECVRDLGGTAVLTSPDHETGTDRVAEVAAARPDADIVVNVQGDQPFVTRAMLQALVQPFADAEPPDMSTVAAPLAPAGLADPNTVKVVCDLRGNALYFSRSPIPYAHTSAPCDALHHIGLYAFQRSFLEAFAGLAATPLERCEGLEQLRALEHGAVIRVGRVEESIIEVNTPADLVAASEHVARGAST